MFFVFFGVSINFCVGLTYVFVFVFLIFLLILEDKGCQAKKGERRIRIRIRSLFTCGLHVILFFFVRLFVGTSFYCQSFEEMSAL